MTIVAQLPFHDLSLSLSLMPYLSNCGSTIFMWHKGYMFGMPDWSWRRREATMCQVRHLVASVVSLHGHANDSRWHSEHDLFWLFKHGEIVSPSYTSSTMSLSNTLTRDHNVSDALDYMRGLLQYRLLLCI